MNIIIILLIIDGCLEYTNINPFAANNAPLFGEFGSWHHCRRNISSRFSLQNFLKIFFLFFPPPPPPSSYCTNGIVTKISCANVSTKKTFVCKCLVQVAWHLLTKLILYIWFQDVALSDNHFFTLWKDGYQTERVTVRFLNSCLS